MKRYFACLAVLLAACSSQVKSQEPQPQDAPDPPSTDATPSGSHTSPCDRPTRYVDITVDGQTYTLPVFVMCDPYTSERDLGDPPPVEAVQAFQKISNPAPVQR